MGIKELRDALVADLAEVGLPVHASLPRRFEAPGLLVLPPRSGSHVESGNQFSTYVLNVDVWIVIRPHTGDELADIEELDGYLEAVLANTAGGWSFLGADVPSLVNFGGTDLPVVLVHLSKAFRL